MAIVINGSGTVTGISVGGLPDDIVDAGTLADNAVGLAQMAGGTDGNIITYDTSGNPAVVATGSDGQILTSAGADAVPAFEAAPGGGLSEADMWRLNTSFAGGGDITTNLERNDSASFSTLGTGMTESSGVFAFPSTGYWLVTFNLGVVMPIDNYTAHSIYYTGDDGSTWVQVAHAYSSSSSTSYYYSSGTKEIFDITDIANQKVKFFSGAGTTTVGNTDSSLTSMVFIKLGAT